jgi:hypothetical protein
MAKTYAFKFTAIPAEFKDGCVSMRISLMTGAPGETKECTLPEALAYLQEFSAKMPGPHAAMLDMANRHDRKPPGFDKATARPLYKETAEVTPTEAELQAAVTAGYNAWTQSKLV